MSEYDAARRRWSPTALSLTVAVWMSLVLNVPFWRSAWPATGGWNLAGPGFLLSLPVVVTLWIALVLELLAWGRARKPVLAALLLIAAPASYFMLTYGVLLDRTMVANVLQTHAAETLELITWRFLLWTLLLGLVPAVLVFLVPLTRVTWRRELWRKTVVLGTLSAALVGIALAFFSSYASLARNHRDLRLQLVPTNVLAATYSYAKRRLAAPAVLQAMGVDAVSRQRPAGARPRVRTVRRAGPARRRSARQGLRPCGRDRTLRRPGRRCAAVRSPLHPPRACPRPTRLRLKKPLFESLPDAYPAGTPAFFRRSSSCFESPCSRPR